MLLGTSGSFRPPLGHRGSCFPFGCLPVLRSTGTLPRQLVGGPTTYGLPLNAPQSFSFPASLDFSCPESYSARGIAPCPRSLVPRIFLRILPFDSPILPALTP